jgi:hypothetical protein
VTEAILIWASLASPQALVPSADECKAAHELAVRRVAEAKVFAVECEKLAKGDVTDKKWLGAKLMIHEREKAVRRAWAAWWVSWPAVPTYQRLEWWRKMIAEN